MRAFSYRFGACLIAGLVAGCGGAVEGVDSSDAGGKGDGSFAHDARAEDGGGSDSGVIDADAGEGCDALFARIDELRKSVTTCCPACEAIQCQHVADDLCCPISVNGGPIDEFVEAVRRAREECDVVCPATICPVPSLACGLDGVCR